MRVAVTGATGRMGREVVSAAAERGHDPLLVHRGDTDGETVEGVAVEPATDLADLLERRDVDALVDFTGPESSVEYVAACADAGVPAVVGTTGFDEDDEAELDRAAERTPVLRASNFSRGVHALRRAVAEAVRALPGYDVEVTETHHNAKRDAPSGTAQDLLADIAAAREVTEFVHGREGDAPREAGEVGVHARRAGNIAGEHEVLVAGGHEVLSLTHRAGDRGVFAVGALDAAEWLVDRDPGRYEFADVIA